MKILISLFLILTIVGCGNIAVIDGSNRRDHYSAEFLKDIDVIKAMYKKGERTQALKKLRAINDAMLNKTEMAMRYNLMGVIFFANGEYQDALAYFERAIKDPIPDDFLLAQAGLNLASTYFKLSDIDRAYDLVKSVNPNKLEEEEKKKFYQLLHIVSSQKQEHADSVRGLLGLVGDEKTLGELKNNEYFEILVNQFAKLGQNEKIRILENHAEKKWTSIAYLGYLESEKLFFQAKKKMSEDLVEWILDNYKDNQEVTALLQNFKNRLSNISKIDSNSIGIVLPFQGIKQNFAERSLRGIDLALKMHRQKGNKVPKIFFENSNGNGIYGAEAVKKLILNHSVAIVVGGLLAKEAVEEYLMAKKYGVLFVSLSPIYLPKYEKNYLLLEIPESVESQISKALNSTMLEKFGKNVGILYPNNARGRSYADELWNNTEINSEFHLTSIQSYESGMKDFRYPVSKMLHLAFKRERQEELDFYKEIHELEGKKTIRRVQNLTPIRNFDWVFVPAYPNEALQILPSFSYYDAFNIKFIGGPSWRDEDLRQRLSSLKDVYFIGPDLKTTESFQMNFRKTYSAIPRLIETLSYDGMEIALKFLKEDTDKRELFNFSIMTSSEVQGITGKWKLTNGIWLKDLEIFRLRRSGPEVVQLEMKSEELQAELTGQELTPGQIEASN